jgi:hypothetical protein
MSRLLDGAQAHLRPRRLRLYGVGNGRSGTTSLTRMFDEYRAAHEIDLDRTRALAARVLAGELDVDSWRVRAALRRRSVRYHLEVDVAGLMAPFARPLVGMYADARFVLLVRDCFSWLDSVVEHRVRRPIADGENYFAVKYLRHCDTFAPEEATLRDANLFPVAAYFQGWADAIQRVLDAVPAERLLVVRTEDLDSSVETLARFAGVPASSLQPQHANRNPSPTGVLGAVPVPFVVAQARAHCTPLMERFWGPAWTDLATRLPQPPR